MNMFIPLSLQQVVNEMMLCHVICRKRIVKAVEGVSRILWTLRRNALSKAQTIYLASAYLPKVRRRCYLPCFTSPGYSWTIFCCGFLDIVSIFTHMPHTFLIDDRPSTPIRSR